MYFWGTLHAFVVLSETFVAVSMWSWACGVSVYRRVNSQLLVGLISSMMKLSVISFKLAIILCYCDNPWATIVLLLLLLMLSADVWLDQQRFTQSSYVFNSLTRTNMNSPGSLMRCLHTLELFKIVYTYESFLSCLQGVNCWHDLDNTEFDCWPINSPNDFNMISCGGEYLYMYLFVWLSAGLTASLRQIFLKI